MEEADAGYTDLTGWVFVVVTITGDTATIRISTDGETLTSGADTHPMDSGWAIDHVRFGGDGESYVLDGQYHHWRVFASTLNDTAILAELTSTDPAGSPWAAWELEDASLQDATANDRDLTGSGGTLSAGATSAPVVSGGTTVDGVGAAAGAATVAGVGASTGTGTASAAGAASVSGIGAATATGTGAAAGTGAVDGIGAADATGVGAAAGSSAVEGIGSADIVATGVGASDGSSACSGVGAASASGVATSAGTATCSGIGASTADAVGASAGSSAVAGVGASTADAVGSAAGSSTCTGIGNAPVSAVTYLGSAGLNDDSQSGTKELPYYVHAGSNRKLLIGFAGDYTTSSPVTGVTYATTAVGSLLRRLEFDATAHKTAYLWYVDDADLPASAGTHMVTVSLAGTVSPMQMYAAEYSGAKQGAATNVVTAVSASDVENSLSITTHAANSLVFSIVGSGYIGTDVLAPTSGQTELQEYAGFGSGGGEVASAIGHEEIAEAGAETSAWEADSATTMGQIAVELEPASTVTYADGVGESAGGSTCTGAGASTATGTGAIAGTSTCEGAGDYTLETDSGVGEASGSSTVVGVGAATATGTGTAAGAASVAGIGAAIACGVGTAAGSSTCTGVGDYVIIHSAADLVVTLEPWPSLVVTLDSYPSLTVTLDASPSLLVSL